MSCDHRYYIDNIGGLCERCGAPFPFPPTAKPTVVPCGTCGRETSMTGTKRCDACWEVEHRLRDYLRVGGAKARAFVEAVLDRTALKKGVQP